VYWLSDEKFREYYQLELGDPAGAAGPDERPPEGG
jgi:hypothetical protein